MTESRGSRRKQLLEDLKEKRGYCKLKMGAQDRTVFANSFWNRLWAFCTADYRINALVRVCSLLQYRLMKVSYNL
jgi:hypothetical protein